MLSIGDLARHTGVSVRMLRHYDALGLVAPERVDPSTGYRWYAVSQIGRVHSLLALKDLGFTLEQCGALLDDRVPVEELSGMLRLRQAELGQRLAADSRRLAAVGRRLRSIERGLTMTNGTLQLKALPALRLAQVSTEVNDTTELGTTTAVLFATLTDRLAAAGLAMTDGGIRTYYGRPDGSKIDVAVALPVDAGIGSVAGLEVVDLPAEERAAAVVHEGPGDEIADAWATMEVALAARGLESYGVHRQVHLDDGADPGRRVVELQCPVREAGSACR